MEIREIKFGSDDYKKSIELRDKILRKPLGMVFTDDFLAQDEKQYNIGAFDGEKIVGILLFQVIEEKLVKMRQVAVDDNLQGKGIGRKLVEFSEKFIKDKGFNKIELNAREVAIPFYEKLNYKPVGKEFIEVGIVHIKMEKILT